MLFSQEVRSFINIRPTNSSSGRVKDLVSGPLKCLIFLGHVERWKKSVEYGGVAGRKDLMSQRTKTSYSAVSECFTFI